MKKKFLDTISAVADPGGNHWESCLQSIVPVKNKSRTILYTTKGCRTYLMFPGLHPGKCLDLMLSRHPSAI